MDDIGLYVDSSVNVEVANIFDVGEKRCGCDEKI